LPRNKIVVGWMVAAKAGLKGETSFRKIRQYPPTANKTTELWQAKRQLPNEAGHAAH